MRKLVTSVLLAAAVARCAPPNADAAPVMVNGPKDLSGILAAGDSLGPYTFTAAAVPGATGYKWSLTISGTNGTWPGAPTSTSTATPSLSFTLATGGVWDSASFQLCVQGTSPVRSSKAPACTNWRVLRYLPSPTALTGDSSKLNPISLMIRSSPQDSLQRGGASVYVHVLTGQRIQFCSFMRFGSGDVVGLDTASACQTVAQANFNPARFHITAQEAAWLSGSCSWAACVGIGALRVRPDMLVVHTL